LVRPTGGGGVSVDLLPSDIVTGWLFRTGSDAVTSLTSRRRLSHTLGLWCGETFCFSKVGSVRRKGRTEAPMWKNAPAPQTETQCRDKIPTRGTPMWRDVLRLKEKPSVKLKHTWNFRCGKNVPTTQRVDQLGTGRYHGGTPMWGNVLLLKGRISATQGPHWSTDVEERPCASKEWPTCYDRLRLCCSFDTLTAHVAGPPGSSDTCSVPARERNELNRQRVSAILHLSLY